jgi:hypothetical protein
MIFLYKLEKLPGISGCEKQARFSPRRETGFAR